MANHGIRISGSTAALMLLGPIVLGALFWLFHNYPAVLGVLFLTVIAVFVWGAWGYDERQAAKRKRHD